MIRRVGLFVISIVFLCTGLAAADIAGSSGIGAVGGPSTETGKIQGKDGRIQEEKGRTLKASFARLPLSFIRNEGQKEKSILFYEQGTGHATVFTDKGISLFLERSGKVETEGANEAITLAPLDALQFTVKAVDKREGKVNYFIGKDPGNWKTNIPTYGEVLYMGVYPGIDMKFYGSNSQLEYDIIVAPNADPSRIKLSCKGAEKLALTPQGELEMVLKSGSVLQKKPFIYQVKEGKRTEVRGKFALVDATTYGFEVGPYDKNLTLVIDPALVFSTYLGGASNDSANAIAVDGSGNVYVAGSAMSTNFPVAVGALQPFIGGGSDAFVTKIGPSGNALIYSTYLGGSQNDSAFAITVDVSGNAYVAGSTMSTNFPTTLNTFQSTNAGGSDAFVTKIGPSGNALIYSTYLGGSQNDSAKAIAVDSLENAYLTGSTSSNNFPLQNALFILAGSGPDAFVTKVNPSGNGLVFSTCLGGFQDDFGNAIAVDADGNVYVAGSTTSTAFPVVVVSAIQPANAGGSDAFVSKINPTGTALAYSTYLGGSSDDYAYAITVDISGNAYVAGSTNSTNFPTQTAFQLQNKGGFDAFVTKIDAAGDALVYSTYLGGFTGNDYAKGVAVDSLGNAYVAGYTSSTEFPVTSNPIQLSNRGGNDAFITNFDPSGTSLIYSTYLGGATDDQANGIAVDASGNAYIAGFTNSVNFHTMGPLQPANAGGYDAFIAKISLSSSVPTLVVTKTGAGTGTILSTPSGINCGSACSATFSKGTIVTLTATAGHDSIFTGWSGGGCSGSDPCEVTMAGKSTVTANFVPSLYTVTASVFGGHGSVSPSTQTVSYLASGSVNMTPDAGYYVLSISDNGKSVPIVNPYVINNVSANHNVLVRFTTDYNLGVAVTGNGAVTSTPAGISCGATCTAPFRQGTKVNLVPVPANGFVFTGWTGACKGTGVCSVTMNSDKAVGATFAAGSCTYTLSPKSKKFTYKGGSVTVSITAKDFTYCPVPDIVNNTTWITSTTAVLTNNRGSVKLFASSLATAAGRSDTITIGGIPFAVSQTGVPCTLTLNPTFSNLHPAAGDTGSFNVETAPNDCEWTAIAAATSGWVTIDSGATGTGPGPVNYTVGPNGTGRARNGTITVKLSISKKTRAFTVKQGGQ